MFRIIKHKCRKVHLMYLLVSLKAPGSDILLDRGRLFWPLSCGSVFSTGETRYSLFHDHLGLLRFGNASVFCVPKFTKKRFSTMRIHQHLPLIPRSFQWLYLKYNFAETEEGPVFCPNKSTFQLGYTVSCWVRCSTIPVTVGVQFWRKPTSVLRQINVTSFQHD